MVDSLYTDYPYTDDIQSTMENAMYAQIRFEDSSSDLEDGIAQKIGA